MSNETRVNLKHLLQDLRDAYASPLEEIVVTELVANALDSGATKIRFDVKPLERLFRCTDNGEGMNRAALRSYHNIAASTKERGFGIGFAGVGAKLALLVAEKVVTESRGKHGAQGAAEWYLKDTFRAPWKFIPFSGLIEQGKGTAVSIYLKDAASMLLDQHFLQKTLQRHFYPLLCEQETLAKTLRTLYKNPIEMLVNDVRVRVDPLASDARPFFVYAGSSRKPIGAGFIEKAKLNENFWSRLFAGDPQRPGETGLRASTYGKVIKGGWEWIGVSVHHPELLCGVVEVPALSEILTTNKSDFLTDPVSLKKYYRIRKAIQQAILPVLRELGESQESGSQKKPPVQFKPLTQDIEGALSLMSQRFPELESLVGAHWRRRLASEEGQRRKKQKTEMETLEGIRDADGKGQEAQRQQGNRSEHLQTDPAGEQVKRTRGAGMEITFEDFPMEGGGSLLGKFVDEKVVVNTAHPAWADAQKLGQETYHVLLTVALTLSEYLPSEQGAGDFVSRFLIAWSEASKRPGTLL